MKIHKQYLASAVFSFLLLYSFDIVGEELAVEIEKEWRAVCQLNPRLTDCKTSSGTSIYLSDREEIAPDSLPNSREYYGIRKYSQFFRTIVDGEELIYEQAEVSNGITMIWSDSSLFDSTEKR